MNRRDVLRAAGTSLALTLGGCLSTAKDSNDDHDCPKETWTVKLYNAADELRTYTITIRDSAGQEVFSGAVELEPNGDRSSAIELDVDVSYNQGYTFEINPPEGDGLVREKTINCGNVYIIVNESAELVIRAEESDHY